jgi:hypothetical protein
VTLTDDTYDLNGAAPGAAINVGTLAAGAAATYFFTGTWAAGQHTDVATVSGTFTDAANRTTTVTDHAHQPADFWPEPCADIAIGKEIAGLLQG